MRRVWVALFLAVAVVAGCGSSTATSGAPGASGGGGNGGGGNATATVIMNGQTYNLSVGTCTDVGVLGTQVAVGDYDLPRADAGPGDYLLLRVQGDTPSTVAGRAGGVPWALATGKQSASIRADKTGTFSGTDFISGSHVEGTFACN